MSELLQNQSYALIADLGKLAADLPVDGSVVFLGRQVIDHSLSWSDEKAGKLGRVVDALCTPLLQAGRRLDALILEYDSGALLIVTRDALRVAVVMRSMVERPDDLIAAARRILDTHGESIFTERGILRAVQAAPAAAVPKPSATAATTTTTGKLIVPAAKARQTLSAAAPANEEPVASPEVPASVAMELAVARLAMVMGRKAASDLVARESAATGLETDSMLDAGSGKDFITRIFSHVPHKAKREALTFECQSLFLESLK